MKSDEKKRCTFISGNHHRGRQPELYTCRTVIVNKHERGEKCLAIGKVCLGCGQKNKF